MLGFSVSLSSSESDHFSDVLSSGWIFETGVCIVVLHLGVSGVALV